MAVNLSPVGGVAAQFFDNDGNVLSGGKIYTYAAGSTTPQSTYTTGAGNIAHANPIILDSAGRVPTGEIWLTDGSVYKFVIKDANDTLIGTYDNIVGINSNFINYTSSQEIQTATAGQTVFTLTTMAYQPGTNTLSVFVDGVNQYGPGAQYAYTETSSTSVTFASGLHKNASVKFTTAVINNAGGVDASQVTYDPPFTGSEVTNVEAKLAQYVSVKDFGAVGDYDPGTGTGTDDTAAIQAALDASFNVFFPEGFYKITASLNLANNHNLQGEWSSDEGTRIWAVNCTTFNVTAKNTNIDGFRIYQNDGYYAFFYDAPIGETSSFNNLNNNNYVVNGGAFHLASFSRSVISNFNSAELKQGIYLSGGVVVNNAISDSLFQGRTNPALNVTGEFAVKVDIGSGGNKEGVNFTNVKFVSFYDGFINNNLSYSTFESCIFDYINNSGYTNSGFNINITFSNCYFGQQAYSAFPVVNGYSAFLNPLSLPTEAGMFILFNGCYFVCYDPTYGPQVLANIREKNNQLEFVNCTDKMSQTNQSIVLYQAKGCIIKDNISLKEVVASGSYSATPNYVFDQTNIVVTTYQGSIREFSSRSELLTSPNANSGTLTSQIMTVNSTNPTKVFKVYVQQESAAYASAKEYLVYMDYVQSAAVNTGIQLISTASLGSGDLDRITLTLTATGANTNKTMTFVWSQNITPKISIERVL